MKAVILVGGEGTRLRPLTCTTPKSMVPIMNRPFLEHMIEYLKGHAIDEIILTLCYLPHHIRDYFGDGSRFGVRLSYVMEECPLGTAGAVKNVAQHLDEPFFVFNGDVFTDLDLTAMLDFHRTREAKVSIALTPVEDPTIYGVVETDESGAIQRFIEKPRWDMVTTNRINAGTYIIDPEILSYIPQGTNYSFEHGLFPHVIESGDPIYGYRSDAYWIDIGTPQKYLKLHHDLLRGSVTNPIHGDLGDGGVFMEGNCDVHDMAELHGPVLIGKDTTIGCRARVIGPAVIGQGSVIGEDSVIRSSVVWHNAHLGRMTWCQDCIIAEGVSIGDRSQVMEGCIVGAHVSIGCDTVVVQDTKVWPRDEVSADHP